MNELDRIKQAMCNGKLSAVERLPCPLDKEIQRLRDELDGAITTVNAQEDDKHKLDIENEQLALENRHLREEKEWWKELALRYNRDLTPDSYINREGE